MKQQTRRHTIQAFAALLTNPKLSGFFTGRIWQGASKQVCVPGLNCYSCPAAVGACPLGALQNALATRGRHFSLYALGFILAFGALFGRLICGFLCPFGFLQDLLYKIKSPKPKVPKRLDKALRWNKYILLVGLVILAPIFLTDAYGLGAPWFCKLVCPAGTLEGGIPILLHNETLRATLGWLFSWKMLVLVSVLAGSVLLYRPFCKYLCPLGAMYGMCNRCSAYRMEIDAHKCTRCGACSRACPMGVDVMNVPNSAECIRCGVCREKCPTGALTAGFCQGGCAVNRKNKTQTM